MARLSRITAELRMLEASPPEGIVAFPVGSSMNELEARTSLNALVWQHFFLSSILLLEAIMC